MILFSGFGQEIISSRNKIVSTTESGSGWGGIASRVFIGSPQSYLGLHIIHNIIASVTAYQKHLVGRENNFSTFQRPILITVKYFAFRKKKKLLTPIFFFKK